jgi:hypothetical protein
MTGPELEALRPGPEQLAVIRAAIDAYNAERPAVRSRVRRRTWVVLSVAFGPPALLILAVQATMPGEIFALQLLFVLGIVAFFTALFLRQPIRTFQQGLRGRILPVIFGFVDDVKYSKGQGPGGALERLRASKLLTFTSTSLGDVITGRDRGEPFELHELELVSGSGRNRSTVFKGLVFVFRRGRAFPGSFLAARRRSQVAALLRGLFGADLPSIASGRAELDGAYEFRSDNPEAARALVRGDLGAALDWLRGEWTDGLPQLALLGNECFLMLASNRDFFELPGIAEDLDYERHIEPMIWDLVRLLALARLVRQV